MFKKINPERAFAAFILIAFLAATALAITGHYAKAAEGEHYTKTMAPNAMTKFEALKTLIVSNNKTKVYKCVEVEASNKGTIKNK